MEPEKKIILVDTNSTYSFHEMFNATFLFVLVNNTNFKITYIADATSIDSITRLLDTGSNVRDLLDSRVKFKRISLFKGNRSFQILLRQIIGAILNIYYLIKYKRHKIIYTQLNPLSAWFIRLISFWQKNDVRIICHGELSYLTQILSWTKPAFWYRKFLKYTFSKDIAENLKLILLGEPIRRNLLEIFPGLKDNLIIIDHPFMFKQDNELIEKQYSEKMIFGWVGVVSESKGFGLFDNLTSKLSKAYPNQFEAHVVGKHSLEPLLYPHLKFAAPPQVFIERERLDRAINNLDFIMFFYSNDQYQLTASGAIFEAIKHNKIIIALRNDYFTYIFEKSGPLGFLCDSEEEIEKIVQQLLKGEIAYSFAKDNLKRARNIFDYRNQVISI